MIRDERFYSHSYATPDQRILWEHTLRRTTTLYPIARRDPIFTPLFVAMGLTGTIAGTTITTASIASAIATTALTFGLQMLMVPKPPKPEDGKAPKTQAIPYRAWCVGTNRMAGAYMLWESLGNNLVAIQAIAGHPVSAYKRFWLHDDVVELADLDALGQRKPSGDPYRDNVYIFRRLGSESAAALPYQSIIDRYAAKPASERLWTSQHLGFGQASVAMLARAAKAKDQQSRFPYGVPNLTAEVDGAKCWDFRNPAQSPTDPATWTFTKNSALILAWHLCFSEFGERLDYTKALLPTLDFWKEEADICDEAVPLFGGGTEKRYECNGWDTAENSPKAGLNAILATCDGHLVVRGDGARILTVGKFRESRCVTLTDADIIGHSIQYDVLFEDEINRLVPKFTYPEVDYATADTDYFEDIPAQLNAGRVLSEEAEYTWVQQWRQARRLGKREWLRIQQKVNGSIDVWNSGINAVYSRWVRLATPIRLPRLNGKIIENRRAVVALTKGGFSMDIKAHPDGIDVWDPATDEGKQPPVPPRQSKDNIPTPVINLVQSKANGSSVYIRVDIIDPADESLTPTVRYRLSDDGTGNPGEWVEQEYPDAVPAGGFTKMNTNVVPSNKLLDIQVAFMTSKKTGTWSLVAQVTSTVDSTAPAVAEALSWASPTFSARAANTTASQGRTAYLTFKIGTTAQTFAAATLINKLAAAPGDVRYVQPTPVAAATRRLWVQPENGSGVVGPTAFLDVTFP
ncbi:hypothetical protein ASG25_01980 [Rhizobium sp. Leaf384]|uniref:hypothetical protein n=1 Tax=unclassified Rhizobium TaxID=2613769 RepID=UPI0007155417|nr:MULTISPECIES: hypothetical protein [unclassified Rhizobium]KQS74208.1 hypothetical protein ASG58_17045 [Rhizobium sp. Leaf383]KQS80403.1 hypothetical protein ASG25_01980 [Rhizobium sp. Leaf384]